MLLHQGRVQPAENVLDFFYFEIAFLEMAPEWPCWKKRADFVAVCPV
jgi:hypothetical protein